MQRFFSRNGSDCLCYTWAMQQPTVIYKTALAVFENKKILLTREAKNKDVFYMLGGKVKENESDIDSLKREVAEEVGCEIAEGSIRFLHEFEAPAHGRENTVVNIKLYGGTFVGEPKPSSEIAEIRYFDSTIEAKHLTPISEEIISWLKDNGYIS